MNGFFRHIYSFTISRSDTVATCWLPKSTISFRPSVVSSTALMVASVGTPAIFTMIDWPDLNSKESYFQLCTGFRIVHC